ncbi:MAG: cell envelope integrity protein CreD [Woeseiaceae bacterium]|nr:cell envelope integrity protein CreD [Woeseiaceae bacterium]
METNLRALKRSPTIKALVIGVLILLLLIPVSMIEDVIRDRNAVHQDARHDIKRSWGYEQLIAGPVLIVPYSTTRIDSKGNEVIESGSVYLLPETLALQADVSPEILKRGLHKVPIYSSAVTIEGRFGAPDRRRLGIADAALDWDKAYIALSVTDPRAIAETPGIDVNNVRARFEAGGQPLFDDLPPPIVAPIGKLPTPADAPLNFGMTLAVNGSDSLQFAPLGDTTTLTMTSAWPDPSFFGSYLPASRSVGEQGFSAVWQISGLGRALPSQWLNRDHPPAQARQSAFGVDFYMPVSLYQATQRATRYAVLFIGLSFVAYFLFEILGGRQLHPLQYLLVGFANALFYLLLLSLAEHIGFGRAYMLSAIASAGLISGYSVTILGGPGRAAIVALILAGLYSFLYMTLKAESFALLGGSIGLWMTLAVIMYMTRRIDWFSQGRDPVPGD